MGDAPGDDQREAPELEQGAPRTAKDVVEYLIINRRELGASLQDGWGDPIIGYLQETHPQFAKTLSKMNKDNVQSVLEGIFGQLYASMYLGPLFKELISTRDMKVLQTHYQVIDVAQYIIARYAKLIKPESLELLKTNANNPGELMEYLPGIIDDLVTAGVGQELLLPSP
jgi:hypothetical protein